MLNELSISASGLRTYFAIAYGCSADHAWLHPWSIWPTSDITVEISQTLLTLIC